MTVGYTVVVVVDGATVVATVVDDAFVAAAAPECVELPHAATVAVAASVAVSASQPARGFEVRAFINRAPSLGPP